MKTSPDRFLPPSLTLASCLTVATMGLSACTESAEQYPVQLVYQDQYCYQDAGLSQLASARELVKLRSKSLAPGAEAAPPPDYQENAKLFLISLGPKNSGGYTLTLNANAAKQVDQTLVLPVGVKEPEPGTMQSMQITSPCLVVAVPSGNYRAVRVGSRPDWQIELKDQGAPVANDVR